MTTPKRDFLTDDNTKAMQPVTHIADTTNSQEYTKVAKLAYDTIQEVMRQGEADGKSGWEDGAMAMYDNFSKAQENLAGWYTGSAIFSDDNSKFLEDGLTYIAMTYYLYKKRQREYNSE